MNLENSENSEANKELCPIENLTDDCLRLIFQYLPIFDRIRIERVCKRWQELSRESWYSFKRLDLSPVTWGWTQRTKIRHIDNEIFQNVLSRCKQYLTVVDLSMRNYPSYRKGLFRSLNVETIALICNSCPNLSALNLTDVKVDQMRNNRNISRRMRYMFLQACERKLDCERARVNVRECERALCLCELPNIRDHEYLGESFQEEEYILIKSLIACCHNFIRFGMRMPFFDETIEHLCTTLLKNMTKVKHLRLTEFPGTYLNHLSFDTIEELFLGAIDGIFPDYLCNVIEKFRKLKTLVLDTSRYINDQGMRKLLSQSGTLKNLGLIGSSNSLSTQGIQQIPRFTHLEKLNVKCNNLVDDKILEALAVNCEQLTYLNVSCCEKVTDNGILSISTLPNLQHLIISQLSNVSDRYLGRIHNLKVLDCQYCPRVGDDGLCVLIDRSPDLRVLIMEGCKLITEKLFDSAVEDAESRSNKVVLYISVSSNENFDVKQFNNATPLLRIVKKITHRESCRMDFKDEHFPIHDDNFVFHEFSAFD